MNVRDYFRKVSKSKEQTEGIEAEYIKNLQQQIYFLELETNYLYPHYMTLISSYTSTVLVIIK